MAFAISSSGSASCLPQLLGLEFIVAGYLSRGKGDRTGGNNTGWEKGHRGRG